MSEKIESMEFEIETKNKVSHSWYSIIMASSEMLEIINLCFLFVHQLMDSLQESLDIEQSRCEDLNDKLNESQVSLALMKLLKGNSYDINLDVSV